MITPEKSIFLFDPLIVLTLILTFCLWKRFASDTKAYVIALAWLLLADIVFYAKYYNWSGDPAWGDRFVTTPVQLLAMFSIPIFMRYGGTLKPWAWKLGKAVAGTSVIIQIASVFFWHRLEPQQMGTLGHPTFVLGLRFVNIVAFATRMTDRWGLSNPYTVRWRESSTPYFFPLLVMRQGTTSGWKLVILFAGWACLLAALAVVLFSVQAKIRRSQESA